jgi:hypothetical protein
LSASVPSMASVFSRSVGAPKAQVASDARLPPRDVNDPVIRHWSVKAASSAFPAMIVFAAIADEGE